VSQSQSDAIEKIFRYIHEKPGCHLRQVKEELKLAMGTVQYHLDRLEKSGKIISARRGLYKHYFPVGMLENQKDILQVLTQETVRDILMFIVEHGNPSQGEISSRIRISAASVNWHIRRLMLLNLIREDKRGRCRHYRLQADSTTIAAMLKSYYPTIWDVWSNRLAEMFLSMSKDED
jgi:predicted transcriptional regulator